MKIMYTGPNDERELNEPKRKYFFYITIFFWYVHCTVYTILW